MSSFLDGVAERILKVRKVVHFPRWFVLRLASISGVSAGWWTMAIVASLVGAVSAVVATTALHEFLKRRSPIEVEAVEPVKEEQGSEVVIE